MLKRLGDPEDGLIYSVKNITVGYASTTTQLPESSLILAFRNIRALETLTWSTWLPITSQILNCLHEAQSSARLVAIALDRNDLPLDELLLSSPQLHTLDIKLSALTGPSDSHSSAERRRCIRQTGAADLSQQKAAKSSRTTLPGPLIEMMII